ncbi:MAG: crossover junction endodeoxyribonuclease RuvC [Acidobacteriota bacterium]
MKILGIDPGSRVTGWGLLESDGWEITHLDHGTLRCRPDEELATRLVRIADGIAELLREHRPEALAVEQVFTSKNARSALVLGHARGVILLEAARAGLVPAEYAATQVKSAVTGSGRADKRQVQAGVSTQLLLSRAPASDAADALAIALTHAAQLRLNRHLRLQDANG